jgi:hypothetical protein
MGAIRSLALPDVGGILESRKNLWADLDPLSEAEPIFKGSPAALRSSVLTLSATAATSVAETDFSSYFQIFVETEHQARRLLERLRNDPSVAYAQVQAPWRPAVRFSETLQMSAISLGVGLPLPPTPDFSALQSYLGPAPTGIDSRHAWSRPGGRGTGVRIVDIESCWNFGHEDLHDNTGGVIFGSAP